MNKNTFPSRDSMPELVRVVGAAGQEAESGVPYAGLCWFCLLSVADSPPVLASGADVDAAFGPTGGAALPALELEAGAPRPPVFVLVTRHPLVFLDDGHRPSGDEVAFPLERLLPSPEDGVCRFLLYQPVHRDRVLATSDTASWGTPDGTLDTEGGEDGRGGAVLGPRCHRCGAGPDMALRPPAAGEIAGRRVPRDPLPRTPMATVGLWPSVSGARSQLRRVHPGDYVSAPREARLPGSAPRPRPWADEAPGITADNEPEVLDLITHTEFSASGSGSPVDPVRRAMYDDRMRPRDESAPARPRPRAVTADPSGRLAVVALADRTRTESGAREASAPEPVEPGTVALTAVEREIAELAARGLTNEQVGERTRLSQRTVATHLYRIYPKLGVTARNALRAALDQLDEVPLATVG